MNVNPYASPAATDVLPVPATSARIRLVSLNLYSFSKFGALFGFSTVIMGLPILCVWVVIFAVFRTYFMRYPLSWVDFLTVVLWTFAGYVGVLLAATAEVAVGAAVAYLPFNWILRRFKRVEMRGEVKSPSPHFSLPQWKRAVRYGISCFATSNLHHGTEAAP